MICPHCQADLKYKERPNRRCSRCMRHFAFEPKDADTLKLHDIRFKRLIDALRGDDGLYYTLTQLLYAIARKTIRGQYQGFLVLLNILVVGAPLGFVIVMANSISNWTLPIIVATFGFALTLFVIFLGIRLWAGSSLFFLPTDTTPTDSWTRSLFVKRWQAVYNEIPPGLITDKMYDAVQTRQPKPYGMRSVLVCPERDVLVCLQANNVPALFNMGLLTVTPNPPNEAEREILEALRDRPEVPVLLLHSADADSIDLAKRLKKMLKLRKKHNVIDLGLHYHQVQEYNLLQVKKRINTLQRDAINKLKLSDEAKKWYLSGGTSPLAAIKPARLIKIATQATERISGGAVPETPEAKAKAVGFMTWPA